MSELSDLNEVDASNTTISGNSTNGAIANMSTMDNVIQSILGLLKRWFRADLFRLRDATDQTKLLAFGLSGITTATTRTMTAPNFDGTMGVQAKGANVASAATTDLSATTGNYVHITGTTTITALGTAAAGIERTLVFDGSLTLTHNSSSLALPGSANITTTAGDTAIFRSEGSGNWKCIDYTKFDGTAVISSIPTGSVVNTASASYAANTDITATIPFDDTIPQSSEGLSVVTISITPASATNRIRVFFTAAGSNSVAPANLVAAAFKTGSVNSIGAAYVTIPTANYVYPLSFACEFVAGVTTAIAIEVRVGTTSGTMRLNGTTTTRLFGGTFLATLRVEEIKA